MPVYGQYTIELPFVVPLVEGVKYSFPKDVTGSRGAIYELSKISAQILSHEIEECNSSVKCVRKNLVKSGIFNESGIRNQEIILKKIEGGRPSAI